MNDMRVKAAQANSNHYPDIAVICGIPQFEEAYDRGAKFAHFRKIATLREYLLLTLDQPSIERYVRQGGSLDIN